MTPREARDGTRPAAMDELLIAAPGAPVPRPRLAHPIWLLLGLVAVALNLRPALSSLAPVLPRVQEALRLDGTMAGLITTMPVLCLGLFAPLAPRLARRYGNATAILAALLVLVAGNALRGLESLPLLVAGTILAGAAIGIGNVLLPGLVKREFPHKAGLMTGVYTMALSFGAAVASGLTVPVERLFNPALDGAGWRAALAIWAIPALVAAIAWLPQLLVGRGGGPGMTAAPVRGLWRDRVAWQVTLFMGLQSSLAYAVFGWLPAILQDRGDSAVTAGLMVSLSVMVQVGAALVVPTLAGRMARQSGLAVAMMACTAAGLLGFLFAPLSTSWGWAILLGIGQGGSFGLALTMIVLRARDAPVAAELSGMSQSVGYTIAAIGPFGIGVLHDWTGGWTAVGIFCAAIAVAAAAFGIGAGRNRHVLAR